MAPAEGLRVEVVYCPGPGLNESVSLQMPEGSTLTDALRACGLVQRHDLPLEGLRAGIWCKAKELSTPLRDGDRVEIYRPLIVDPKEARRLRYKRHKSGSAGPATPAR